MQDTEYGYKDHMIRPEATLVRADQGDILKTKHWLVFKDDELATQETFRTSQLAEKWIDGRP